MIVTVSTVKDELSNVQRFVKGNLASGVDHMIIFLDASEAAVETWLAERPEVTVMVTDRTWWQGSRPKLLNRRQNVNANVARTVLKDLGWAEWLFHIDADEIARIDRAALAGVPPRRPAVNLQPLEVVGVLEPDGEPTLFKRLLTDRELRDLVSRGLLAEPTNSRYFRSHVAGKVGVRPNAEVWLGIHKATDRNGQRVPLVRKPGLELLHYESYSGEEFVRKWTNMVTSGPRMNFGEHRMGLAQELKDLVNAGLVAEVKAARLSDFYQRHMADPVNELASLGLLREVDPSSGIHTPTPLPPEQRNALVTALEAVRDQDKTRFLPPKAGQTAPGDGGKPQARDVARSLWRRVGRT